MKNPIVGFDIYVNDLERAKKFYETVLGVSLEKLVDPENTQMNMWSFPSDMEGYGIAGALVKMEGCPAGGSSTIVYFGCDDCAVEASRVEAAGGKIQHSKKSIGEYGFIVRVVDTEGNMFGLHSME